MSPEASGRRNGIWAVAQQLTNIALTGVFGVILVRYLSVSDFGIYSYATTLVGLAVAAMSGGLQGLAMREFANRPTEADRLLAAVVLVRESLAFIAYCILLGFTAAFGDHSVLLASAVALLAVLARAFDAPELWFQANLQSARPARIRIFVSLGFFLLRISIVISAPNIYYLLASLVAEQLVLGSLMFAQFRHHRPNREPMHPDLGGARSLLRMSAPLALSGIANQVNLRVDLILIQILSGNTMAGLYAAATRISEILFAVPVAYMNATFPVLLAARRESDTEGAYRQQLQRAYDGAFWFGILVITGAWLFGDFAVDTLFGDRYSSAADVLQIQVLACPFVFMAAVFSKWILAENKLWLSVGRHVSGATAAIILNLILIPRYGIEGSAWGTVVSYSISSYLFCFLTRSTWPVAGMMTFAATAPVRLILNLARQRRLRT